MKPIEINSLDIKLKAPFTCQVNGPTGSGKTFLLRELLKDFKKTTNLDKLNCLWCYGVDQELYHENISGDGLQLIYHEGLPSISQIESYNLIVLDDLMNEVADNVEMGKIFTRYSHHMNLSVIFVTQNLFMKGKEMRTITTNAQYYILMKSSRDFVQVACLGRQIMYNQSKFFIDAYRDATANPYGYLLVDMKNDTPDALRLRTKIIGKESLVEGIITPIIYINNVKKS